MNGIDAVPPLVAAIILLAVLTIMPLRAETRVGLALALMLVSAMNVGDLVANGARIAALLVLAPTVRHPALSPGEIEKRRDPGLVAAITLVFALIGVLQVFAAVAPGGTPSTLPTDLAGVVVGYGLAVLIYNAAQNADLTVVVGVTLCIAVTASLLVGAAMPAVGLLQGRLTGIFANPNTVGLVSFSLISLVVLSFMRTHRLGVPATVLAILGLIWSGSRSSAASSLLVIVLALFIRSHGRLRRFFFWGGAFSVIIVGILYGSQFWDLTLFRDTQSRSGWDWAQQIIGSNLATGVGKIQIDGGYRLWSVESFVGSSPLTAGVWAGISGLVLIGLIYLCIVIASVRVGPRTTILAVAFVGHSFFESWLDVGSGAFLIVFVVIWSTIAAGERRHRRARSWPDDDGTGVTRLWHASTQPRPGSGAA